MEKPVPCLAPMRSSVPDDAKWIWAKNKGELVVDGKTTDVLGGSAVLPPSEVLAIFNMIEYLSAQMERCRAVTTR